jgi:hypothetical protein
MLARELREHETVSGEEMMQALGPGGGKQE